MKTADLLDGIAMHAARWPDQENIGGLCGVGFAGGGGSSLGLKQAGLPVDFAMNHDAAAIAMHAANCPEAEHFCQDIWQVRPESVRPGEPIRFMWFSPDCKHFSRAKGAVPVDKKIRDLAWVMLLWAKIRRPDVFAMENVEEFMKWGPIGPNSKPIKSREGEYFRAFKREWKRLGYVYGFTKLVAADYGDPTTRLRMFGQFRCDGQPISWPERTHAPRTHPDVLSGKLQPWVPAAAILDFSLPVYSIFMTREEARAAKIDINRPLVDNTFARITLGLQRWVLEADEAYIINITNGSAPPRARPTSDPLWTQTCAKGGEYALAVPSLTPLTHQGAPRSHDVLDPARTITGANRGEIALSAAHIVKFRANNDGASLEEPAPGMTANSFVKRPGGAAPVGLSAAFMAKSASGNVPTSPDDPAQTQEGHAKTGLVAAHLVRYHGQGEGGDVRGSDLSDPALAETAGGNRTGLVAVHMIQNNSGNDGHDVLDPASTVLSKVGHHALAASHICHLRGGGYRPGYSVERPLVALTAEGTHLAEVRTFLVKYYGSATVGQPTTAPFDCITTKPRFALIEASTSDFDLTDDQRYNAYWVARLIDVFGHPDGRQKKRRPRKGMGSLRYRTLIDKIDEMHRPRPSAVGRDGFIVWDLGMRMLSVRERFRAQGVPDSFITDVEVEGKRITETKKGELCGNMVCPGSAKAIAKAALRELRDDREAMAA